MPEGKPDSSTRTLATLNVVCAASVRVTTLPADSAKVVIAVVPDKFAGAAVTTSLIDHKSAVEAANEPAVAPKKVPAISSKGELWLAPRVAAVVFCKRLNPVAPKVVVLFPLKVNAPENLAAPENVPVPKPAPDAKVGVPLKFGVPLSVVTAAVGIVAVPVKLGLARGASSASAASAREVSVATARST